MSYLFSLIWLTIESRQRLPDRPSRNLRQRLWQRFKQWLYEPITTRDWYISEPPRKKYNKKEESQTSPVCEKDEHGSN